MADTLSPLDRLKSFLNEIFQFETQDLDFGIYKIMHYKRKEIRNFIDRLLVEKVKEQLKTISDDETKSIGLQLKELEKDDVIKGWLAATDSDKTTLEKIYPDKFRLYQELTAKTKDVKVSEETENLIYNHLTQFFSRYYDKGDFISKRRFGKNEKYVLPYNGEETHFYWANHDQYYIKSSETFQHYAFRVSTHTGTLTVHFKLHNAQLEQGNVKADESNFFMLAGKAPEIKENDEDLNFILADKKPEIGDHDVTFYFEYRPLDDSEKAKIKGNNKQDALDEIAYEFLKKEFSANPLFANLWKEQEGKPLLLKKLHHYTRKNKYDFFIHKNLKAFLERELDFYIKSELVNVDDLYVTDTEEHFDRLKHNLKTIKVFKSIADTIIDFVHQIEDFQKKLWEKKKFVISTDWVITIDRLVEYLYNDEKLYRPILEEVIRNKNQVAEWKDLFGEENIPKKLSVDALKADLHSWKKLPLDSIHYSKKFRKNFINYLSSSVDLEEKSDGLVIYSDNYHGINLIKERYKGKIKCCYIDPPYNGKSSEIIYKNTFKHSSWSALMQNRVHESKELLMEDSVKIVAIDENEIEYLGLILKGEFGDKKITCIPVIINPGGTQDDNFAYVHDYAYFIYNPIGKQIAFEDREDTPDIRNFMNTAKGDTENYLRESGANCFYPIFIKDEAIIGFGDVCDEDFHPSSPNIIRGEIIEIYPIDINGVERKWVFARNTVEQILQDLKPKKNKKTRLWEIERVKSKLNYKTVWTDNKYSAKTYGTGLLKSILGKNVAKNFSFPKSIYTVYDSINAGLNETLNGYVLDYFAGSGTTFHATQMLNEKDNGKRKCILIE
jgi:adenine-specific DNA-methyltransferase